MLIQDVIGRARHEPPYEPPDFPTPGAKFVCRVNDTVPWDHSDIERELGVTIPEPLGDLWRGCGGMILFEDSVYRQSGLVVLGASSAVSKTREHRQRNAEDALPSDIVFGEFHGDLRLALVRADRSARDFGSVVIAAEMDPREYWYVAASSLDEFLMRFMDAHGDDYWDVHYEAILARRRVAATEKAR